MVKSAYADMPGEAVKIDTRKVEPKVEPDEEADEIETLGRELVAAAKDRAKRSAVLQQIDGLLQNLSEAEMRAMAEHPVVLKFLDIRARNVQKADDPPGTIYSYRGIPFSKKPWTEADLRKSFENGSMPKVKFSLETPVPFVCWNSIVRSYDADVQYEDYACFYDLILESRRGLKFAKEHAEYLMGTREHPTHRDMLDPSTMRVRATATGGGELVGGASLDSIHPYPEEEGK